MFCDGCGAALQSGQYFCSRCGKEVKEGMRFDAPRPGRVRQHLRLLGILWLALGALNALGGVILLILANTLFVHMRERGGPAFLPPLLTFIAFFILVKAAAEFAAGWGLQQHESWARVLALVLAFLALFNVPLGTALGIYSLWVLMPAESEEEYQAQARTVPAA
ncbi:MAG TPA: zinc ribbon domain-containing protein [Terriglobales bacterium]|nr:zinc ribbon domain-containing protein [Terriglobales bacterium]